MRQNSKLRKTKPQAAKRATAKRTTAKPAAIITVSTIIAAVALLLLIVHVIKPPVTGHATAFASLYVTGITFSHDCNLTLASGWNLISVPCAAENSSIASVLQGMNGSYYSVHSYEPNDTSDLWKSYKPDLPGWVEQDLQVINVSRGYWIRMLNSTSLNVSGIIRLPHTIRLETGWNLVGYPTNSSQTPAEVFSSISSSISSVHAYNATDASDNWKAYFQSINESLNDLTLIVPYWGYWINATAPVNWQIREG